MKRARRDLFARARLALQKHGDRGRGRPRELREHGANGGAGENGPPELLRGGRPGADERRGARVDLDDDRAEPHLVAGREDDLGDAPAPKPGAVARAEVLTFDVRPRAAREARVFSRERRVLERAGGSVAATDHHRAAGLELDRLGSTGVINEQREA